MSRKKKSDLAVSLGVACAENTFKTFSDPENRGSAFVWPDSLYRLLEGTVRTQAFLYDIKAFEGVAQEAALRRLTELLHAERRS